MPDYQQGKIYRLVSNKTEDVYYGATTRTLTHRKNHHKSYLDCSSKKLFENDAVVTIILVEAFPCNNKNELKARELFHITNNACINTNKPFISELNHGVEWHKEYYENNKDEILERQKTNYENNKEIILKKQSEYYQNNKEAIAERDKKYRESHKEENAEYQKEYRESNKEKIAEQKKEWYEANKEKTAEYKKEWYEANKEAISERRRQAYKNKKAKQ
jgi:hypothetical protein